jgi:phosphatidylserine decarboxylase
MSTLTAEEVNRPIETIHPDNLVDATHEHVAQGLSEIVDHSSTKHDVTHHIHAPVHLVHSLPFIHKLVPGLEELSTKFHVGNFVIVRGTDTRIFESMPIYARLGMHLLFYGKEQVKILGNKKVEHILQEQSIKEGKIYDSPESAKSIPSFIKAYNLQVDELLNPDISSYKTFNEFFYRKLKPGARPVQNDADPNALCSAADSRLTVFQTFDLAKEFWVKGRNFTVPNLLDISPDEAVKFDGASVAIFRLAPADYHRFHSPIDCIVGDTHHIPGQYYTVNPQAVNEPGFDVFTANTRSVLYLTHKQTGLPVAFVAIGALLVGSIAFTAKKGQEVKRGEELGYFAYGGSTVVAVLPPGVIEFDEDLIRNSKQSIETLMKVGYSLGHIPQK